MKNILTFLSIALLSASCLAQKKSAQKESWISLFNGKDLTGWTPKIRHYVSGDNFANTFRVEDGKMVVRYDGYDKFDARYGHIFYKDKYSYYRIKLQYRFVGQQANEGEGWAYRNSGIMVHGQTPETMGKDQDFPVSIEVQLLGGNEKDPRTTCNLCTPGTNVVMNDKLITTHCINSTSKTYHGDQWVEAEVEVYGDSLIRHRVNGEEVLLYEKPQIGDGMVNGQESKFGIDGQLLKEGTISLQSESHPVEFKNIRLLNLEGCMDKKAKNYKSYYVKHKESECRY